MSGLWTGRQRTDAKNRDSSESSKPKISVFRRPSLAPSMSNRDILSKDVFLANEQRSFSMPVQAQSSDADGYGQYASTNASLETAPFRPTRRASATVSSTGSRPGSAVGPTGGNKDRSPIIQARDSDKAAQRSGTYCWGSARMSCCTRDASRVASDTS